MAEEKILYLSPEEDLTDVRGRLEKTAAQRIILVIPQQTRLRGTVSWQVLHALMEELHKDVRIVSPNPQISSVAKHAGFKVSASSKSSSPGRARSGPAARSDRSMTRKKSSSHLRPSERRSGKLSPQSPQSPQSPHPPQQPQQPEPEYPTSTITDLPAMSQPFDIHEVQDIEDIEDIQNIGPIHEEEPITAEMPPKTPTFETQEKQFGPPYHFRIEDTPPIHSVGNEPDEPEDDEQEFYLEDFHRAESIREAARYAQQQQQQEPKTDIPPESASFAGAGTSPFYGRGYIDEDPLNNIDDFQPSTLPEQLGGVSVDDAGTQTFDIAERPTSIIDGTLEDVGDEGDIVQHSSPTSHVWSEEHRPGRNTHMDEESMEEQDEQEPHPRDWGQQPEPPTFSYLPGFHGRASRGGNISPMQPPPPQQGQDDGQDYALPPISEQPTRTFERPAASASATPPTNRPPDQMVPPTSSRTNFATGQSEPRAVALPKPGGKQSRPVPTSQTRTRQQPQQPQQPGRGRGITGAASTPSRPVHRSTPPAKRKSGNERWLFITLIILVFLLLGLLAYLGPSANVTVFLPSRSFSQPMTFTASSTSSTGQHTPTTAQQQQTLPAQTLAFNPAPLSAKGQASGSTKVGTNKATGKVRFTNNGSQPVDVPTGTVLTTSNGIQFVTTADVVISTAGSNVGNTSVTTVEAQNSGSFGNVASDSIVTIPTDSKTQIQQANPGETINLSVTNPDPTTGGGVGNATALSANNVKAEQAVLDKQLQSQLQDWLKKQQQPGDQMGKPVTTETITTVPAIGSAVPDGTFTATLNFHTTVLIVRSHDIQKAAITQLNTALSKNTQYAGYSVVQSQPVQLKKVQNKQSKDGSSFTLNFTATGQIVPQNIAQNIPGLLTGKLLSNLPMKSGSKENGVQHYLLKNPDPQADPHYQNLDMTINVNPGFFPWVPFSASRINVQVMPVTVTGK